MKKLTIISLLLTLLSCTKEVEIDIPGYEEQVVIDGLIEINTPPIVLISKTKQIYQPTSLDDYLNGFLSGAIITVSDGTNSVVLQEFCTDNLPAGSQEFAAQIFGIPADQLGSFHICGYASLDPSIFGKANTTYTLKVEFEGKTYTSSTTIPEPTKLDAVYWKPYGDLTDFGYSWATLTDPASQYDAYKWEVKRINKDSTGKSIDPYFKKTFNPVFDDDFFDGLTFDFFYENPMTFSNQEIPYEERGLYQIGDTVVVKFSKMDAITFNYLEKKYAQLATNGNPFATPTPIPSNISGGAIGLWAGYAQSYDTLFCKP
jgi:hypothetical protein